MNNDDFLNSINLEADLDGLYNIVTDDNLKKSHEEKIRLTNLRNNNYKKYKEINIKKYNGLPNDFRNVVFEMCKDYKKINSKTILDENIYEASNTKRKLNNVYSKINRLNEMAKTTLKELELENDKNQSDYDLVYFKNLDYSEEDTKELIKMYKDLVLFNSVMEKDLYENLKRQLKRKELINNIQVKLNLLEKAKQDKLKKELSVDMNEQIFEAMEETNDKIQYLSDLISDDNENRDTFDDFVNFYNKITNYDENSYDDVKQTYDIFTDDSKLNVYIDNIENKLLNKNKENEIIDLIENQGPDENVSYVISFVKSLECNYTDKLESYQVNVLNETKNNINGQNINLEIIFNNLVQINNLIWKKEITDIYSYNFNEEFSFLCTNNQFLEPKQEVILINKNILNGMINYLDYQIGFICEYKNNVRYTTSNEDIMSVEENKYSKLITPKDIENKYLNENILTRIVIDGRNTEIQAVYYIDDGDINKYLNAVELSNMYSLPLIVLKKDK